MNKANLQHILDIERFRPAIYCLDGGSPNDRLCLAEERGGWSVYYSERGERFDEDWFASEDDACQELLHRLRELPIVQSRLSTSS